MPTVGFWEEEVSYERGTPVNSDIDFRVYQVRKSLERINRVANVLTRHKQGFLAHKKLPPPRTLQKAYT